MPNINCGFSAPLHWVEYTGDIDLQYAVHIWRLSIPAMLPALGEALVLLNAGEIDRANRYFQDKDRQRFILGRAMLRTIIANYIADKPEKIVFDIAADKKPRLPGNGLQFNITHSGEMVLVAVANVPVGIDIEKVDDAFDYAEVLSSVFSEAEIASVRHNGRDHFYRCWTRKESLVKALGMGMDERVLQLPCLDGDHTISETDTAITSGWLVRTFYTQPGYMSSIAFPAPERKIMCYNFNSLAFT